MIDTHIHLDAVEFAADRAEVLAAARAAGVRGFIVPAVAHDNFAAVMGLAAAHADVHCALGVHPMYVHEAVPEDLDALDAELAAGGGAVAVGEIGLDYYVEGFDAAVQERYFIAQLKLARRHDLPVILHSRRAVDAVLSGLRRIGVPGGVAHAFSGSRQQAEQFIALGFKLGFGGAMTYSGSRRIRALAAELPLEAIVLETDAPDIAPAWASRQRNEPANLLRIAQELAALRGEPFDHIVATTTANAAAVFGTRIVQ